MSRVCRSLAGGGGGLSGTQGPWICRVFYRAAAHIQFYDNFEEEEEVS